MAMGVSLQTRDHFSGSGGTAPKCHNSMVAAQETISHGYILLCAYPVCSNGACPGVLYVMGAVKGKSALWVAGL